MSITRTELVRWLSTIEAKGRTLDIGGGIWSMKGKVKDFDGTYLAVDEQLGDLNNQWVFGNELGEFDNIFCTEVMQFVYRPDMVLDNLHLLLKSTGKLYLSFHLTHPPMKDHDYLRYTEKGIRKLLEITEFVIDEFIEPVEGYYLVKCSRL